MTSQLDRRGGRLGSAGYRVSRYLRKYGLRAAGARALSMVKSRVMMDETHVWYELVLPAERPHVELAPGYDFRQATTTEIALIEQLPTVAMTEAQRRIDTGNDLWFVFYGDQPAFACWIFRERMPMLAAPEGVLRLPPESVCLEDSVTSADHRGKGLAPAAWSMLADVLQSEGVHSMLTKVADTNTPSRRAVTKAGFKECGVMRFRRWGPMSRVLLHDARGDAGAALTAQLDRSAAQRRR